MRRIIYRSIAAPDLDQAAMFHLLYRARLANQARGLTGVLLRSDDRLLQVLEGPTWKLSAAFEAIRRDPRHLHVEVLDERSIPQAAFPESPMRYFDGRRIGKVAEFLDGQPAGAVPAAVETVVRNFFISAFVVPREVSPSLR